MLEAYAGEDVWRAGHPRPTSSAIATATPPATTCGARSRRPAPRAWSTSPTISRSSRACRWSAPRASARGQHRAQADAKRVQPRPQGRGRRPARSAGACRCWCSRRAAPPFRRVLEGSLTLERAGLRRGGRQWRPARLFPHALHPGDGARAGAGACRRSSRSTSSACCATTSRSPRRITSRSARRSTCSWPCRGDANPVVAQGAVARWGQVHGFATEADRPRVAALAARAMAAAAAPLGFDPKPGESLRRHRLARRPGATLGTMGEPTVAAEARRRFAALASDPQSARRAAQDHLAGDRRPQRDARRMGPRSPRWPKARRPRSSSRPITRCSAPCKDAALAQKALDFALTGEAGTTSADIIAAVAGEHADLAFDFALANRAKVEALVDAAGLPATSPGSPPLRAIRR